MSRSVRETLFVAVFLSLVFGIMAFPATSEWFDGTLKRIGASLLAGVGMSLFFFVFMALFHLLFDELPKAIRRALRTPEQKYVDLLNSRTPKGREERDRLMVNFEPVAESERFRQTVYIDRATGQHWLWSYVEESWTSYYELSLLDPERAAETIARFADRP